MIPRIIQVRSDVDSNIKSCLMIVGIDLEKRWFMINIKVQNFTSTILITAIVNIIHQLIW